MTQQTIPKIQKAIIFEKNGDPLVYKDIPVPTPAPNELLIHVLYSGDWPLATKSPLVGGHEGAGVVVGMGSAVKNWKLGDLAGIKWLNGSCMNCEFCMHGDEPNCAHADLSGYTHDGSFQQYATADAVQAGRIPAGTNLSEIAPILCAGVTAYKAIKTAELKPGDWCCISGSGGGLGTLAIQFAKAMGLRVIGIDGGAGKEKLCLDLGAEKYIDFTKTKDIVKDVIAATDGGPHAVINVSVSERAIDASVNYVRPTGTVVLVGLPAGAVCKSEVFSQVVRSVKIKGSYVGNRCDTAEAIDFYVRGLVKSPIKVIGLSELPMVYDLMEKGEILGRYVVDTSR
ncbi:hypothetical protein PACTADRAFT_85870 [Pachysolen tannophilus NRRL Y-2460]|uniref:alcohol dehydrogenase n=2 Tax=Pachysolen tannophilus TaxID=4918 RepID=A0A1E4TSC3_PACTA|nr:hypothetical protein PACTADRAFT_85870 [Pachysolen tannophilus NRRL Y-2460]